MAPPLSTFVSLMGLRTKFRRTDSQSIKLMAIMAAIIIHPSCCNYENHRVNSKLGVQGSSSGGFGVLALLLAPPMPRLRGKPRRGAGWYVADSRRKRHGKFQRVVRLARQNRRRMITVASSPPGTRVEEDPDLDLPSDFSESKMFTIPDNWDPPTRFLAPAATSRPTGVPGSFAVPNDEYTTCVVEEEPPSSYTGLQANAKVPKNKKEVKETKKEPEEPASPSPLHPELLQLIFEVHSLVDDQLFRAVCISQRLDMLYAAYSNTTPRQQCPTCSQPFAIPASSGKSQEACKDSGG